jgi:hypothetical protein
MPEPPSGRVGGRSETVSRDYPLETRMVKDTVTGSRLGTASPYHLLSKVRCPPRRQRGARGSHTRVGPPLRVNQIVPLHLGEVELRPFRA